ncbi:MAG: phage virion morphogenesis protein [Chlorobiaceae bacterium]
MITARFIKGENLEGKFRAAIPDLRSALQKTVMRLALQLTAKVKGEKLSGQVLKVRTGRLRRSIHPEWDFKPGYTGATVGTNVEYAAIHEYGLAVERAAFTNLRSRNQHAGRTIQYKERSFLRSSLKEMTPDITAQLKRSVREELIKIKK